MFSRPEASPPLAGACARHGVSLTFAAKHVLILDITAFPISSLPMNKPLLLIYFQTIFLPVSEGLYVDLARGPVESNPADIFELRMPRLSH